MYETYTCLGHDLRPISHCSTRERTQKVTDLLASHVSEVTLHDLLWTIMNEQALIYLVGYAIRDRKRSTY